MAGSKPGMQLMTSDSVRFSMQYNSTFELLDVKLANEVLIEVLI
jgi:hypothetical protein